MNAADGTAAKGAWVFWIAISLLAGLALLGVGIREAVIQRRLQQRGTRVDGLVVSHRRSSSGPRGGTVHFATVQFADTHGTGHLFESKSSGVRGLPVGGRVPVRYLPDDPRHARIDLAHRRIGDVAFVLLGGVLFTGVGIWLLVTGR